MSDQVPDPRYSNPSVNAINAIALPVFAVLSAIFLIFPFRAFYLLRNFPACSICITLWIINLSTFINSIIWHTDDWTTWWPGYGLCDIESILRWPVTLSASSGLCCFVRGLSKALDTDSAIINPSKSQRRRHLFVEILIIWGIPVLQIGLHYIIQAGRYSIVPVFGCTDELDNSWPSLIFLLIWGPIYSLITSYYAVLMLYRLRKHRKTIASALSTTGSGMVPRKFVKLAMISLSILIVYLPIQILFIFRAIPRYWVAYDWNRIHNPAYWSAISYYHTEDIPYLQYSGWATISYGFLMLPFYGFNNDAIRTYRRWMVILGLGKCWPSLKEPYRPRGRRGSSTESIGWLHSRESLGRFDLVSKVMKYFDIDSHPRSLSRGTHQSFPERRSFSRKGSQNISFSSTTIADNSTIDERIASDSTSPISAAKDLVITKTISSASPTHNRFATIRSWSLFTYFSSLSSKVAPQPSTDCSTTIGDEKLFIDTGNTGKDLEANNISINIWSSNSADDMEIQEAADPLSPPLGSRAYRERERREMKRDEMEREALAKRAKGETSVVVQTQVERKEEGRSYTNSQF